MTLVGKYFVELQGEDAVVGKVMERIDSDFYLINYNPGKTDPPLHLVPTMQMAVDDYRFFATKEEALAELHRLSDEPDKVVTLVKTKKKDN
jgi:hypothetical protein